MENKIEYLKKLWQRWVKAESLNLLMCLPSDVVECIRFGLIVDGSVTEEPDGPSEFITHSIVLKYNHDVLQITKHDQNFFESYWTFEKNQEILYTTVATENESDRIDYLFCTIGDIGFTIGVGILGILMPRCERVNKNR